LVSMGIILIIAHNWDELDKTLKVIFAFIPLLTAQSLCLYTLLRRRSNTAWKEGSSTFLFFSLGACMALISQIYHIPGNLAEFVFAWMIFCLPAFHIMRSSVLSVLYLAGITYYAREPGYWSGASGSALWYWMM